MPNLISSIFKYTTKFATAAPKTVGRGLWNAVSSKGLREGIKATQTVLKEDMKVGANKITDLFSGSYAQTPVSRFANWTGNKGRSISNIVNSKIPTFTRTGKLAWDKMPLGKMIAGGALVTGGIYGASSAIIQRVDQRTQMSAGRQMAPNNLGTDGLTLALSRRRHRN